MPESKRWAPSHWTDYKVHAYLKRVLGHARRDAEYIVGPHNGRLVAAQMFAEIAGDASRAMLNQRGVKTFGELQG